MEVTWRQLEKIIMSSIETAVRTTVIETERQYAASYAGKSSSLSSVGNYATFISRAGTSIDGAVMPVASPRSSVWKNPKKATNSNESRLYDGSWWADGFNQIHPLWI